MLVMDEWERWIGSDGSERICTDRLVVTLLTEQCETAVRTQVLGGFGLKGLKSKREVTLPDRATQGSSLSLHISITAQASAQGHCKCEEGVRYKVDVQKNVCTKCPSSPKRLRTLRLSSFFKQQHRQTSAALVPCT